MAVKCPKCQNGNLKKSEKMVYCENYKPKKSDDGKWVNEGSCDFRIMLNNKIFGKLTPQNVKDLVEKGEILSADKKKKLILDLENQYFCRVEFLEQEDEYL